VTSSLVIQRSGVYVIVK